MGLFLLASALYVNATAPALVLCSDSVSVITAGWGWGAGLGNYVLKYHPGCFSCAPRAPG